MEIIGIDSLSYKSLKAAYRSLAKIHHPDLFASLGADQQELAREKFTSINLAHDYLESLIKN